MQDQKRSDKILDAFLEVAKKYTVSRTTMQDVARHAGMSIGTLYLEFDNKAAMINELVRRMTAKLTDILEEECRDAGHPADVIRILTVRLFEIQQHAIDENPSLVEFVFRDAYVRSLRQELEKNHEEFAKSIHNKLCAALEKGIEMGDFMVDDVSATANIFIHTFRHYALEAIEQGRRENALTEVRVMFDLLIRGLGNAARV